MTVNKILKLISEEYDSDVPKTHATLFQTHKMPTFSIESCGKDGQFQYFGIAYQLRRMLNVTLHDDKEPLILQFNKDGLPLFKSSSREFWPILGKVVFKPRIYKPFKVGLYFGKGKPNNVQEFLKKFIEELKFILKNGVKIDEKHYKIKVMCFINDIPARVFVKCIKAHTGYFSCERCNIQGVYVGNRVIFTHIHAEKRTNETF